MKCCICGDDIAPDLTPEGKIGWDQGNNAEPVIERGRCCNACNWTVVIPRRLKDATRKHGHKLTNT